jgi:hypothetical protein
MAIHRRDTSASVVGVITIVFVSWSGLSSASPDVIAAPRESFCGAAAPRMPPRMQVAVDLRRAVEVMLSRSPTFRNQCRRLAVAKLLYVRMRYDGRLAERSVRARTIVQRYRSGVIIAMVEIRPTGPPEEWIAHEFEHVLEQIEGVRLPELAGRVRGVWRASSDMFETERAIRAGQLVAGEVRRRQASDILVE